MNQGYPLYMIAYGIGVLPLIRDIRGANPRVTQPWYADDAGAGGGFGHILEHFQYLQARGPPRGYFLDTTKSILVVAPRNVARAEKFFRGMGVKIVTGSHYLGFFVRYRAAEYSWLEEKVQGWAELVKTLVRFSRKHLQSA